MRVPREVWGWLALVERDQKLRVPEVQGDHRVEVDLGQAAVSHGQQAIRLIRRDVIQLRAKILQAFIQQEPMTVGNPIDRGAPVDLKQLLKAQEGRRRREAPRAMRVARVPGSQIVPGIERRDLRQLALERRAQDRREDGVRFMLEINQVC